MKRIGIVLTMVGLMGTFGVIQAVGQGGEEGKKDRPAGGHQGVRGGDRGGPMAGMLNDWMLRRVISDPKMLADLGLTEEQIKAIKDAADQAQKQREEFLKQLSETDQQQRKLMEEATVDEAAVMALLEKTSKIRLEMEKAGIKVVLAAKKTLTPEQITKIKDMAQQQMRNRVEGRKGDAGAPPKSEKPAGEKPAEKPVEKPVGQ